MDNNLYYILGGIAYGIFILQFIISWVAGEFDVNEPVTIRKYEDNKLYID